MKTPSFREAFKFEKFTADDWPILALPDDELESLAIAVMETLADDLKTIHCYQAAALMLFAVWKKPAPKEEILKGLKGFKAWAIKMRALQINVSERTIRNWIERWGLFVVSIAHDEQLFQKLSMLQRSGCEGIKEWKNEHRKYRKDPMVKYFSA